MTSARKNQQVLMDREIRLISRKIKVTIQFQNLLRHNLGKICQITQNRTYL